MALQVFASIAMLGDSFYNFWKATQACPKEGCHAEPSFRSENVFLSHLIRTGDLASVVPWPYPLCHRVCLDWEGLVNGRKNSSGWRSWHRLISAPAIVGNGQSMKLIAFSFQSRFKNRLFNDSLQTNVIPSFAGLQQITLNMFVLSASYSKSGKAFQFSKMSVFLFLFAIYRMFL